MYLFGASGHAKAIISALESQNIPLMGVFDDNPELELCLGYPVQRWPEQGLPAETKLILAIGINKTREKLVQRIGASHNYGNIIHRMAFVSQHSRIGQGTVIMASATVQAAAHIGDHVIINTSASVDHDCQIGDFVHIGPNATLCGGVSVGHGSLIGAGCTIVPGIRIGRDVVIGAGSVVLRDVEDGQHLNGLIKIEKK